ncbi:MAG: hypothetical protein HC836_12530 [Richelia sp. RM2_1_2]|nr:hypothetical protein [Richelia sp. RM2_1_2]
MIKNLTDNELIKNVKYNQCSDSLNEIKNRHSGIFRAHIKKYMRFNLCDNQSFLISDFFDKEYFILYDCIKRFDENKNVKFVSYYGSYLYWRIIDLKKEFGRNNEKLNNFVFSYNSIPPEKQDELQAYCKNFNDKMQDNIYEENIKNLELAINFIKNKKAKNIFILRYFSKNKVVSFKEISKN